MIIFIVSILLLFVARRTLHWIFDRGTPPSQDALP